MRKIVSVFLAAIMLLSLVQVAALADNDKKLTYTVFPTPKRTSVTAQ